MTGLGFFGGRLISNTRLAPLMETIYVFRVLGFLLVALGAGSFGFAVASLALLSEAPLAFCGTFGIDRPRLTVHAVMDLGHVPTVVVALDVLPRLAPLTEDRITIVILEGTDALDSVRFILPGGHGVRDGTVRDGRVQRAGDRVRVRGGMRGCDDGGGICHNLTAYPLTRRDCRSSSAPSDRDASGHGASQPSRMLSSETCPQPPKQPFQPSDPRSTDDPVAARPSRMLCLQGVDARAISKRNGDTLSSDCGRQDLSTYADREEREGEEPRVCSVRNRRKHQ